MVKDFAELELLLSVIYAAMVVISTMEPIEQDLITRLPQIKEGILWAVLGLAVWLAADRLEKLMKRRTKK